MAKNDLRSKIEERVRVANTHRPLEVKLKEYGLLSEDSVVFESVGLKLSHLNIEVPEDFKSEEEAYSARVSLWFDFITTICADYGVEPILLTENDSIPNLAFISKLLHGVNPEPCEFCSGKGTIKESLTVVKVCDPCDGLGFKVNYEGLK